LEGESKSETEADQPPLKEIEPELPPELDEPASAPILLESQVESISSSRMLYWVLVAVVGLGGLGYIQLAKDPQYQPQQLLAKLKMLVDDISANNSVSTPTPTETSAGTITSTTINTSTNKTTNKTTTPSTLSFNSNASQESSAAENQAVLKESVTEAPASKPANVESVKELIEPVQKAVPEPTDAIPDRLTEQAETAVELAVEKLQQDATEIQDTVSRPEVAPETALETAVEVMTEAGSDKDTSPTPGQLQITDIQIRDAQLTVAPDTSTETEQQEITEPSSIQEESVSLETPQIQEPAVPLQPTEPNTLTTQQSASEEAEQIVASVAQALEDADANGTSTTDEIHSAIAATNGISTEPANEQSQRAESEARSAQIKVLLKQAEIHEKAFRLTIPDNSNAVLTYRRILTLQPNHSVATRGISRISERYRDRAQQAILVNNWGVAAQNYARLLWMDPNDSDASEGVKLLQKQMNGQ
ncbi:MAG: hypothetical protein OQK12_12630, partial [Motiliproteus sp.]|nr:hypothetical protein [Motiliproteus sp.]